MSRINLLDPSLGIQNVMDMPTESALPRARDMGANALSEPGLEELYAPSNAQRYVESLLCPDVGDGSIVAGTCSCAMCKRTVINAGIETVVIRDTKTEYRTISVSDWIENDDSLEGTFGY